MGARDKGGFLSALPRLSTVETRFTIPLLAFGCASCASIRR
jgi:hypothetical protein